MAECGRQPLTGSEALRVFRRMSSHNQSKMTWAAVVEDNRHTVIRKIHTFPQFELQEENSFRCQFLRGNAHLLLHRVPPLAHRHPLRQLSFEDRIPIVLDLG
jgi:hypothetical protein